jgi:branched-chain amino acid transport system substrate-binding protein
MATTTVAAGLLVLGLLVGAGITYVIVPTKTTTSISTTTVGGAGSTTTITVGGAGSTVTITSTLTNTIASSALAQCGCTVTIGDIYDATGSQSSYGAQNKVAINLAIADVNAYLKTIGDTVQFAVDHIDDQTDPAVALTDLQSLASEGIQVTIGPYFSGAAENMLAFAQSNQIVMISPQATSPTFDTATHPYLFLVAPTDDLGAKGMAAILANQGIKAAILIYRNDAWGDPYSSFLNSSFYGLGGEATDLIPYTPITSGSYDFSAQLTAAQTAFTSLASTYGAKNVAMVGVGFDETGTIFQQAAAGYPTLAGALWETPDVDTGTTSVVGQAALKTIVAGDVFSPSTSTKYTNFENAMAKAIGASPEVYSTTSYDAAWLAALSILAAGKNSGAAVNAVYTEVANNYFGVSGWTNTNQYGDRYNTDYGVWQMVANSTNPSGIPVWVQVGLFSADGTLTFTTPLAVPEP